MSCLVRTWLVTALALICFAAVSTCHAADPVDALKEMLGNEGGLNCRHDDQGNIMPDGTFRCTNWGVAPRYNPTIDTLHLTPEQAVKLVYGPMFKRLRLDKMADQIKANEATDGATNMGEPFEARLMQEAFNLSNGHGADVKLDGRITDEFMRRFNKVDGVVLYINMVGLRYDRYKWLATTNPEKYERDFHEWLRRVGRNVRRAVHEYEAGLATKRSHR